MAKLILAPFISDLRGSVGDITFQHSRAGQTFKRKVSPAYPASTKQLAVMQGMRDSVHLFETSLASLPAFLALQSVDEKMSAMNLFNKLNAGSFYRNELITLSMPNPLVQIAPVVTATAHHLGNRIVWSWVDNYPAGYDKTFIAVRALGSSHFFHQYDHVLLSALHGVSGPLSIPADYQTYWFARNSVSGYFSCVFSNVVSL